MCKIHDLIILLLRINSIRELTLTWYTDRKFAKTSLLYKKYILSLKDIIEDCVLFLEYSFNFVYINVNN